MLCLLGETAYLIGYHGKAATHFAGSCCLNGRIQGQQAGLFGYVLDDGNEGTNAAGGFVKAAGRFGIALGMVADRVGACLQAAHRLLGLGEYLAQRGQGLLLIHQTARCAGHRFAHILDQMITHFPATEQLLGQGLLALGNADTRIELPLSFVQLCRQGAELLLQLPVQFLGLLQLCAQLTAFEHVLLLDGQGGV